MSFKKIYLDSNVLISAFGREDSSEAAALLVKIIDAFDGKQPVPFATSELSLAETMVRPLREQREEEILGFDALLVSRDWLAVEPVSRNVLWGAALLRSRYPQIKLPDAIHISTALLAGCTHFLSADRKIRGWYGALHWNDQPWADGSVTEVIRPSIETLQAVLTWLDQ